MDLSHLTTTNNAPHSREVRHIQRELDTVSKQVADHTETILKYEARHGPLQPLVSALQKVPQKIASHKAQLHDLEANQAALRSLLSPLRKFPAEILGSIFEALLHVVPSRRRSTELARLNLVSKGWRDAALLTPILWSRVEFPLPARPESVQEALRWLERSGTLSKSLTLTLCDHTSRGACFRLFRWIVLALMKAEVTITHLSMTFSFTECFDELMSVVSIYQGLYGSGSWGNIKSVKLLFKRKFSGFKAESIRSLPPVESFELLLPPWIPSYQPFLIGSEADIAGIPPNFLHPLTTLSLRTQWRPSLLGVLQECPNLKVLSLDILLSEMIRVDPTVRSRSIPGKGSRLPLPNLQTLRLRRLCASSLVLLHALDIPKLSELDISLQEDSPKGNGYKHEGDQPGGVCGRLDSDYLADLAQHVNLRRLRLHGVSFRWDWRWGIAGILSNLPHLTHITLDSVEYHKWFFSNSEPPGSDTARVSDLEELHLLDANSRRIAEMVDHLPELMLKTSRNNRLRLVKVTASRSTKFPPRSFDHPGWSSLRRCRVQVLVGYTEFLTNP